MEAALKNSSGGSRRSGLLKHQLQLVKRKDSDRYEIASIAEPLSFEKGFFLFIRAMQLLTQKMERGVVVVGLAGPSGAGKTVFTDKVSNFYPGVATISMDNYNDASRLVDGNFDDPRLTDYDTLLCNISDLINGNPTNVPVYDFKLSKRTGYKQVDVPAARVVIIEGIYALSERLRPLLDLRVSVTGGVHFDLVKRVLRDINRSGQEPEDIIHQISETVYPMYKAFIEPDLQTAHIKIVNKFNPFSGFQSATYILKSARVVSEDEIRAVLSSDYTVTTEETYDIYLLPPGEDPETCQSYLRMRNRDGKYSLMFEFLFNSSLTRAALLRSSNGEIGIIDIGHEGGHRSNAQEWVTDNQFIISPRITFEVSVRLLGGLMALGYEMATILKRTSHVFSDERVSVKIDKLEQLQRKYIQVQGKDRLVVAEVASKLGLDGSYIPRSYIEQIQLEKLTAEVMAFPDELKDKLSLTDDMIASPLPSFSWLSDVKPGARSFYSKSLNWTRNASKVPKMSSQHIDTEPQRPNRTPALKLSSIWSDAASTKRFDERVPDSPASYVGDQAFMKISEQLAGMSERLDELLSHVSELEAKFPSASGLRAANFTTSSNAPVGSYGSNGVYSNGIANGNIASVAQTSIDSTLHDEVRILARGQRLLTTQLDVLNNMVRDNLGNPQQKQIPFERRTSSWFGNMKTSESGLATAAIVLAVCVCTVTAVVATRTQKSI